MAGDFNGWKPIFEMSRKDGNKWSLKHKFPIIKDEVQKFQYKYVINGSDWKVNNDFPKVNDGKGNINNLLEIKSDSFSSQNIVSSTPV